MLSGFVTKQHVSCHVTLLLLPRPGTRLPDEPHIVGLQLIKKLNITNVVPVEQKHILSLKPIAVKLEGFDQKFCFAVPEGNKQLLAQLNEGLAIISSGVAQPRIRAAAGVANITRFSSSIPIIPSPAVFRTRLSLARVVRS